MHRKLTSVLLTLALMVAMFSGLSLTASAENQYPTWPEMTGALSARYINKDGTQVTRLEVGETFSLELWMNGIAPYAMTVPINWDPSVVQMVNKRTGTVVSNGLKKESNLGDGFEIGEACYDTSWGWDYLPKYWNGRLVFSTPQSGSDGYPYVDNDKGFCRMFFYVDAPTPPAEPQLILRLTFKVLKQGKPNFHFATSADTYYDLASPKGLTMAFTETGVVPSKMVLPEVYVISNWQEETPVPPDPGIGNPDDPNGKPNTDDPVTPPDPKPPVGDKAQLVTASHLNSFPYSAPISAQAVIEQVATEIQQTDNYVIPGSSLAAAINSLVSSSASSILVKMPDQIISKNDYTISFSCANFDDLVNRKNAIIYFETPYGYVGVDAGAVLSQVGDKAQLTLATSPVSGGVKVNVLVNGKSLAGFNSPAMVIILPYRGTGTPKVTSSTVFGSYTKGAQPLSVSHYYASQNVISFMTPSAGTFTVGDQVAQNFSDVKTSYWGYNAISTLSRIGIVNGQTATTYKPEGRVTRAELAKLITCTLSTYRTNLSTKFTDVKTSDWFFPFIASANSVGIVNGQSETKFAPNENVTRQDMAVMAYRGLQKMGVQLKYVRSAPNFKDAGSIASYAKEAVTALYRAGIINGMGDDTFQPKGTATRAQAAQVIYGLYQQVQGLV